MNAVRRAETIRAPARSKPSGESARDLAPGLYLVATPIGNLRDLTFRARDTLAAADLIACEDTRITARLLAHYGIATRLCLYHDHNAERARPVLLERLAGGARVALVSDAGTPLVSDPGYKLVREALARGIPVTTVPGPSAALSALQLSGLPSDRFLFAGFLPAKSAARRAALRELAPVPATLVFFESSARLAASLSDMAEMLGERRAAVAREITKLYEEVRRASLAELAHFYASAGPPRGEIAVVVGAPPQPEATSAERVDALLQAALAEHSPRDAAASVARQTGAPKRLVYRRAIELAGAARG
jgi:16S rRNA (cytidine1402-2'-O)-methyltransferase